MKTTRPELLAALLGLIIIALIMLTTPDHPAMHGEQIAQFYATTHIK